MDDRRLTTRARWLLLFLAACGTSAPPPCAAGTDCPRPAGSPMRVVDITHGPMGTEPTWPKPRAEETLGSEGCATSGGPCAGDEGALAPLAPPSRAQGPFLMSAHVDLKDPAKATRTAPLGFRVRFETTQGDVELDCHRAWAPHGADRFFNLVTLGFYDDMAFFRTVRGFMTQFGIHGAPEVAQAWRAAHIPPDRVVESNLRGRLSFAQAGAAVMPGDTADNRTTQLFINLQDNGRLDAMGFAPVCEIAQGMDVVDALYGGYGERPSRDQGTIQQQGNVFLRKTYPELDYIIRARVIFTSP